MRLNSIIKRQLQDLHQKIQFHLKKGVLVSELEDVVFKIKVFTKSEEVSVKNYKIVEGFFNTLQKQGVLTWNLPYSSEDISRYRDVIEGEEILTDYEVHIYNYKKLSDLFEEAGIENQDTEFVDDGRLLIYTNGEFYIGEDRRSLALVNKTKTKYYKVLKAIFDLSKNHPNGMTANAIIKKISGTKKSNLTKTKIINAINDSVRRKLGEQYDFFEWLENGKLLFKNPLLKDFEKPKNGKK